MVFAALHGVRPKRFALREPDIQTANRVKDSLRRLGTTLTGAAVWRKTPMIGRSALSHHSNPGPSWHGLALISNAGTLPMI